MSGSSGGTTSSLPSSLDWNTIIKPFVTYSVGSLSRLELIALIKGIVESHAEFEDSVARTHPYAIFYDVVTVLSVHVITASAINETLQKSNFPATSEAVKVLTESLISRFSHILKSSHPILSIKTYLHVIKEFHSGTLILEPEEITTILALLKNQPLPPKVQTSAPSTWDKEGAIKESRRTRLDPSVLLFDQIALPIRTSDSSDSLSNLLANKVKSSFQRIKAGQKLVRACLTLPHIKSLHPDSITIKSVDILSFYSKIIAKYSSPNLGGIEEELNLVFRVLSLPLFGPLTSAEATELTHLAISGLNAAFITVQNFYSVPDSSSPTSSLAEDVYSTGIAIVSQAIWMQKCVVSILKEDSSLPQSTWLNFSFVMAKQIMLNINGYMLQVSPGKEGKSVSLSAVQGVWNELITPLAATGISLIENFISIPSAEGEESEFPPSFEKVDALMSNNERLALYFNSEDSIELLFQLLALSFRRACRLKLLKYKNGKAEETSTKPVEEVKESGGTSLTVPSLSKRGGGGGGGSRSSSVTTSEGTHGVGNVENEIDVEIEDGQSLSDFMTSEEDDEFHEEDEEEVGAPPPPPPPPPPEEGESKGGRDEVDDEPLLGSWLESILAPSESEGSGGHALGSKEEGGVRKGEWRTGDEVQILIRQYIMDKASPEGFIESALSTLRFLTREIVSSENEIVIKALKRSSSERNLALLATIMGDLDREKSLTDRGAISTLFDEGINFCFVEFYTESGKLVQNLLAASILTSKHIAYFLGLLRINLSSSSGEWPMGLQPKSLAVLVQHLLLRPDKDTLTVSILKRVLETLASTILRTPLENSTGYGDLNVEHAQTLVFLFHSLSLMQKKGILVEMASTLIRVSRELGGVVEDEEQLLSLSRLLLLFDYLTRQLYEPHLTLVTQVQFNLFNSGDGVVEEERGMELPQARLFSKFSPLSSVQGEEPTHPIPLFYNLTAGEPNYQESPKLDGLAMNFLMSKGEGSSKEGTETKGASVDYPELLQSLFRLMRLKISLKTGGEGENKEKLRKAEVRYFTQFLIRIFFSLPPPHEFLSGFKTGGSTDFPSALYFLIWAPRLTHKTFSSWLREIFSKQGLSAQGTEELVRDVGRTLANTRLCSRLLNCTREWVEEFRGLKEVSCPGLLIAIEFVFSYFVRGRRGSGTGGQSELILEEGKDDGPSEKSERELCGLLKDILLSLHDTLRRRICGNEVEDESQLGAFFELMSLSSEYLNSNSVSLIIKDHLDSPYREIYEKIRGKVILDVTDRSGPTESTAQLCGDLIPLETHLHSVISNHLLVGDDVESVKYLFGSLLGVIESELIKSGSSAYLKEELVNNLQPLLLDKFTEYIGKTMGKIIDPEVYSSGGGAPLNSSLTSLILTKTLSIITSTNLKIVLEKENLDEFMILAFKALAEMIRSSTSIAEKGVKGILNNKETLTSFLSFLATVESEEVLVSGTEFLALLLSSLSPPPPSSSDLLDTLNSIPHLHLLPEVYLTRATSPDSFGTLAKLLGSVLDLLLLGGSKYSSGAESLVSSLLTHTLRTVKALFGEERWESGGVLLRTLVRMGGVSGEVVGEGGVSGHGVLTKEMTTWFIDFVERGDLEKVESCEEVLSAMDIILNYLLSVGRSMTNGGGRVERESTPASNPPVDECEELENVAEILDDDDEESLVDDDSDDEGLNAKLCTYTITQKEFMAQHWYHCHSCGMTDRVGVCSICARVCHRGHDVTYSKFGSFFCDCGGRPDGGCLALTRRSSTALQDFPPTVQGEPVPQPLPNPKENPPGPRPSEAILPDSATSSTSPSKIPTTSSDHLCQRIKLNDTTQKIVLDSFKTLATKIPLRLLPQLKSAVERVSGEKTAIGSFLRVQKALGKLRKSRDNELEFKSSDELLLQNLSSQEGAFENIKMQYSGDQGAQIRQLITSQVIRRSIIAPLSGPGSGKRHFLTVSQEKGKVTILQLGLLLSGFEGSKKKLSLPRLAALTLPFTALTMAANSERDDVLAICGLKDCQVIVVGTGGTIVSQLIIKLQLETNNHIIKPLWIPGSETELALATSEGVKIIDLGKDVEHSAFHFLLPTGKVRDLTFVIQKSGRYIIIMGSDGKMYSEKLDESTSAVNGPYYITNDLNYDDTEFSSPPSSSSSSSSEGKGCSLHYSHPLSLLFYTYPNGKSFVGTLEDLGSPAPLSKGLLITSDKSTSLGLFGWTEVLGHPGLIFALGLNSSCYSLLLTGNGSFIQEIKLQQKTKPVDMVSIRHFGPMGLPKTSLLVLCDDGSLRVFISSELTDFWLNMRPQTEQSSSSIARSSSNRVGGLNKRMSKYYRVRGGQLIFPSDFFEHATPLSEVEFGGNDLLQIYNPTQLKNRLNGPNLYIVCGKSSGFNLEVTCSDGSTVITGVRVALGGHDSARAPSFIKIMGRTINVQTTRSRWYDIPLTREESLKADQKLTITFGPSNDTNYVTIVDSVKVYGKTKDAFAWPDDSEEITEKIKNQFPSSAPIQQTDKLFKEKESILEKVIGECIELLDLSLKSSTLEDKGLQESTPVLLQLVTGLYLENFLPISSPTRSLLSTLLHSPSGFLEHRDRALLSHSLLLLMGMEGRENIEDIDPEHYTHLLMGIKNIALLRPNHIATYPYTDIGYGPMDILRVVEVLVSIFLRLVRIKPKNPYVVSLDRTGIQKIGTVSWALGEILYAVMSSTHSLIPSLAPSLVQLLASDPEISLPVRGVFIRRMRPKVSKKRKGFSFFSSEDPDLTPRVSQTQLTSSSAPQPPLPHPPPQLGGDEPMEIEGGVGLPQEIMNINALDHFEEEDGFPPVLDIHSDAEDEAMVELAIALSLQEQAGGAALAIQGIQDELQALEEMHQEVLAHQEELNNAQHEEEELNEEMNQGDNGGESDATASPPPSDDEASTPPAASLRNEQGGGSDSSGSSNASGPGRRKGKGEGKGGVEDEDDEEEMRLRGVSKSGEGLSSSSHGLKSSNNEGESERTSTKPFRLSLLRSLSSHLQHCNSALTLIPILQVVLQILFELDGETGEEVSVVEDLIDALIKLLRIKEMKRSMEWKRTNETEMALVILRMLSICVSRFRSTEQRENIWIAVTTAACIKSEGIIPFCKEFLYILRPTWKGNGDEEDKVAAPSAKILKPAPVTNAPDLHPFFLKQYVKGHGSDLLEELPLLLSEMSLRIPYQIKKVMPKSSTSCFDEEWETLLCEMLYSRHTPFVRKQARKLLLNMAGTRDGYHLLRDIYHVKHHLSSFRTLIGGEGRGTKVEFSYSTLVSLVEHLNSIIDIATLRPGSWQTFCRSNDVLRFMVEVSSRTDDSLTTSILTLLKIAVDGVGFDSKSESPMAKLSNDEKGTKSLAHLVIDTVEKRSFLEFIKKYLLEHGQVSTRWHAHALLLAFFLTSDSAHQLKLVSALWELWPFVPAAGSRAAQFVDILGYATLKNDDIKSGDLSSHVLRLTKSIEEQGTCLLEHPNANIYSSLVPFVSVDGYYLESEPCGVCYNIDRSYSLQKLATVKADAKYTANHQFIKLTTTLNIVRLGLRLTEIKKARMIKTMWVYYSRKNISIVELKNHRSLWEVAKKVTLSPSQTEVTLNFSVPITAANLIVEFSEFYENSSGTSETLQCPRCSASVPASPGVCSNCGENVFQCHKCRAINYDERDPFLCHSCGFCKYAKMDLGLYAKSIVAVDPIETEEDHKKAESSVSSLLEKADFIYKQSQSQKATLENMLQSIKERRSMAGFPPQAQLPPLPNQQGTAVTQPIAAQLPASYAAILSGSGLTGGGNNNLTLVNVSGNPGGVGGQGAAAPASSSHRNFQSLACCYAIDCKSSYEELNRLMSRVEAYRKEMLKLDPTAYPLDTMDNVTYRRCYGCMAASITQSLKLLQALITAKSASLPFQNSFLEFLVRLSQAAGSTSLKEQIRNALCFFVRNDEVGTRQLSTMIVYRVKTVLENQFWSDLSFETSEELSLLSSLLQMHDSCWEIKLRALMEIFTISLKRFHHPLGNDCGLLPCLKIIQTFLKGSQSPNEQGKSEIETVEEVRVDLEGWMKNNPKDSFSEWKRCGPKVVKEIVLAPTVVPSVSSRKSKKVVPTIVVDPAESKKVYLSKKYGRIWLDKYFNVTKRPLVFNKDLGWMKKLLFYPGSVQTRSLTASLLKDLASHPARRLKIMELLTHFMKELPEYGESCREFMELYRTLATPPEFSAFLNAKGALNIVCSLLEVEIDKLHIRESRTLHSDLSTGIPVWELSKLLSTLAIPSVCRSKRRSLLSTVLGGYLALKRLKLHRTRPLDEAQEILLSLLEDQVITKGTEEETRVFMSVCVETLKKCPRDDLITPVFVFERLCSLILHEESDVAEFYVTLDKDPQQEDFLQGRMLGNPYKSSDSGIGPLMRDIKNKICTECELVALLEDDNGMELLVNNKIISLDLPVKEVYKRLWVPSNGQMEAMRIVYRMRGLLGDATEEFVETFTTPSDGTEDSETTYKLANVLVYSGGLEVVLKSLENVLATPFVVSRGKPFIAVILKLLGYQVKVKQGRKAFLNPELRAVETLLPILELCLKNELTCISGSSGVVILADQVLEILDSILTDAYQLPVEEFEVFAKFRGSKLMIQNLIALTEFVKGKQPTLTTFLKVLGCLTFNDMEKMDLFFHYYGDSFNFFNFDEDPNSELSARLDQFCTLVSSIPPGVYGRSFKDLALQRSLVSTCLEYIRKRSPTLEPPLGRPDTEEWREMVSRPALKYVLRILGGLATDSPPTQEVLSPLIRVIHQLEQVSSDEHVGSLAENALEALRSHERIWKEVESARRATREEKKRLAMAMRTRQLNAIGMKTNEKGQVTAAGNSLLEQMEELGEETGLLCVICREGYKFQPTKVLGIYTFSKRVPLEETEGKSRKSYGYSTVSHFNVVHVDCHMSAIRLARGRDEWESASLQNGNTRCNGLVPLWGPQVPESAFAASLARHNAYLQEATGHRDVGFSSGVHDIKLLLLRFAEEKSFHEDTGGGGPESNLHLLPYLIHTALYVINTTRSFHKEAGNLEKFLSQPQGTWKDDIGTVDGLYYNLVLCLMVYSPTRWKEVRGSFLKRVIMFGGVKSKRMATAEFSHLRSSLVFFGLIHALYSLVFNDVSGTGEWSSMLADYIRRHDEALVNSTTELLNFYQQKLLTSKSLEEIFVAFGIADEIGDVGKLMDSLWNGTVYI